MEGKNKTLEKEKVKKSFKETTMKTAKSIVVILPILVGILLLMGLLNTLIPSSFYAKIFTNNIFLDSIIGAAAGSILFGNPVTSYILGGEFLNQGVGMVAVLAFIIAWVTVGFIQLPIEIKALGKKFAFTRNIVSFVFSIIIAIITVLIAGLI